MQIQYEYVAKHLRLFLFTELMNDKFERIIWQWPIISNASVSQKKMFENGDFEIT